MSDLDDPLLCRLRNGEEILPALKARSRLLASLRAIFDERSFCEVSTPILAVAPDPALHLDSFRTELVLADGRRQPLFLPTSPEFFMKRLLAAGMERIYQIGPFCRNGEITTLHNPEFTGLEWYQVGIQVQELMQFTEELVREAAARVVGATLVLRMGKAVELSRPFRRMSLLEALRSLAGVEVPEDWNEIGLRRALSRAGIRTESDDRFDDLVNRVLIERVEPALQDLGPVFLFEYPAPMAALARLRQDRPAVAERFELYAGGLELCNGYGELTDPREQHARFELQCRERSRLGKFVPPLDRAFLSALESGMPPACGCAMGLDRLLMLLLGKEKIDEVLAFPLAQELSSLLGPS